MMLELLMLEPTEVPFNTFECSDAFCLNTYIRSCFVFSISNQRLSSFCSTFFSLWFNTLIDLAFSLASNSSFDSCTTTAACLLIMSVGDWLPSGVVSFLLARSWMIFCLSFAVFSLVYSSYLTFCSFFIGFFSNSEEDSLSYAFSISSIILLTITDSLALFWPFSIT